MHIPDGFLSAQAAAATAGLSLAGVGWAARSVRRTLPPRQVPLLGLAGAFIFAAQMLNFPVAGGTSGHLVGSVLAAALLGPSAGILVMTSVLIVQCLLFADGGLLSLGANVFNMGIVGAAGGYAVYWAVSRAVSGLRGRIAAAAFAAWCSVVLASIACAAELAASGVVRWSAAFPAMGGIHMAIGIGEAVITALVLGALAATRPDLLHEERPDAAGFRNVIVYGALIAVGLALFVAPFASPLPDGLESVAGRLGFMHEAARRPAVTAPIPDYSFPGVRSPVAATAAAGLAGTVVMFLFAFLLARFVAPRRGPDDHASRLP